MELVEWKEGSLVEWKGDRYTKINTNLKIRSVVNAGNAQYGVQDSETQLG